MRDLDHVLERLVASAESRLDFWIGFVRAADIRRVAEVGVYRGVFAARLLDAAERIDTYYMIDPWRHLEDWNKPANRTDARFEALYREAMARTAAHAERRVVLRGRTTDVVDSISDGELDLAYIDGDHTLRGIAIDLLRVYPKIRDQGFIGGDDFKPSIWQHDRAFEPTLVFPYVVHFAEAVGARLHAVGHGQFLLQKGHADGYAFVDHTGLYGDRTLRGQLLG